METKVTAIPNGPLMVEGTIHVTKPDGTQEVKEHKTFLCRCGHSANKPYCDGSHKKNNFAG
jgi:CDGSH-type Zn-finger protein